MRSLRLYFRKERNVASSYIFLQRRCNKSYVIFSIIKKYKESIYRFACLILDISKKLLLLNKIIITI